MIGTRCAIASWRPQERRRGGRLSSMRWRRSLPTFFSCHRIPRLLLSAGPKVRNLSGRLVKAPGATSFRMVVTTCSPGAESRAFASTSSLLDSDSATCCVGRDTHTLGLVHELLVLARQAHKLAAVPMTLVKCARRQTFWKCPTVNHRKAAILAHGS